MNQAKFTPFTHKSRKLRKIHTKIYPHLVHYFQISDHQQRTPRKLQRINQISRSSPTAPAKFTESTTNCSSNLGVNPVNSRKIQRTTQILRHSHNTSANHAKFATFANNRQDELCTSYTYCTYFTAYISRILAHL